jgi:H+/Cl- antiporter ClcA
MSQAGAPVTTPAPGSDPGAGISGVQYLRLIGLGALIGVPAALLAAAFLAFVEVCEGWLWTDLPDALGVTEPPWYLVLGLPVVGALLVLAARLALPGDGGHDPLGGLSMAPTPWQHAPSVVLAALGTLVFGAVLGPEAPLIALGSVVGSFVTVFVRLGPQETQVLATAGSFSAVSALFGGPLVAGMLLVEAGIGMGATLIPALLPGLVAAAVGYVLFTGLGSWGGLDHTAIHIPGLPAYEGTSVTDLLLAILVGLVAAAVVVVVRRLGAATHALGRPRPGAGRVRPMALLLVGGALVVGALALVARALGADSQDVLFSGQNSIPTLVQQDSVKIVVVLLVCKGIGYAVSLGSGFRGGPVFPAIFLGVGLATLAHILLGMSPTAAVAVGTAAGMAAMTRLLFSSVLFAVILTGSAGFDAVPAAVLAASAAWVALRVVDQRTADAGAAGAADGPTGATAATS